MNFQVFWDILSCQVVKSHVSANFGASVLLCVCIQRRERKLLLNVGRFLPMDTPLCSTRFESSLCIFTEACTVTACFVGKSTDLMCGVTRLPIPAREMCSVSLCTSFIRFP